MEDLKARAVRSGMVRLCGQGANFVLRFGSLAVLARLLNPEDFGLVAMVTVIIGVYGLFMSAGPSSATVQKATITDEQISTLFWINLLMGVILGLLCVATAPVLAAFYGEPRLFWVTVAMAAGLLFSAAGAQHSALLQRQLRYVALTVIETLSLVLSALLAVGMAIAGLEYWALVAAAVASPAISTVGVWLATAWIPGMPRWGSETGSMLRFGGTLTLNGLVVYVAYNLEKVLLGRFWGPDALGIYERAYQLINIPTANINSAIGGVAFSALSRLQHDPVRLKSYFLKGYSLVNSMTLPATMSCALFADDIVLVVLGPKWIEAASIFRLLAPTILIFGIINPLGWLLVSIGLQMRSLAIAFVIAPLVIAAYVIELPYGPRGVAFAYSAAMTLWLVPHILWCLHNTVISARELLLSLSRSFLSSVVAATVVLAVQFYLGHLQSPFLRLLLGGAVMVGVYLWMLLFVMDQRRFYFDLLKGLKSSPSAT